MSLFDLLNADVVPTFGRNGARQAYINDIFNQMMSTPGVYDSVYSAVSQEMGKGTGGKATSWAISMNTDLLGIDKDTVKNDPARATAIGAIYKMAEIGADAYGTYANAGANADAANAVADAVIFGLKSAPGQKTIYEGLTTAGFVGQTLSTLNRINSDGELYTSYVLPTVSGNPQQKAFVGMLDYRDSGGRLDVGSSAGAFLQLAADKTLLGNAFVKMYDYFTGNSPTFLTDYRSAAMYENIYTGGDSAMIGSAATKAANLIGFAGSIGENMLATYAGGMGGMAALNIAKGRLTDYEHSTGFDERFNTGKFFRSMAFDAATIAVSLAVSQPLAKGVLQATGQGPDGIFTLSRGLATRDPAFIGKMAAVAAQTMALDTGIDMAIDYSFHNLGTSMFGKESFTPTQISRFDLSNGVDIRKLINEFMFRSSMRVGSALARGAIVKKTAGPAPIMSEAWIKENFDMKKGRPLLNNFSAKAAAFMWKVYPSNLGAVDQIMKTTSGNTLTQMLKAEGSTGKPNTFTQAYNYFWHQAEKQSNIFYRSFSNLTGDRMGGFNVDLFHAIMTSPDPISELHIESFLNGNKLGDITTEEHANILGNYLKDYINTAINDTDIESLQRQFADNPEAAKGSEEWYRVAYAIKELGEFFNAIGIGQVSDQTAGAIKSVLSNAIRGSINDKIGTSLPEDSTNHFAQFTTRSDENISGKTGLSSEINKLLLINTEVGGEGDDSGSGRPAIVANYSSVKENPSITTDNVKVAKNNLLRGIVSDNVLKEVWTINKDSLDKLSLSLDNFMKSTRAHQRAMIELGYIEDVREEVVRDAAGNTVVDSNGNTVTRTVVVPAMYKDAETGTMKPKPSFLPSWEATLAPETTGDASTEMPVIQRVSEEAGKLKKELSEAKEKGDTDYVVAGFKSLAHYLDIMGGASARVVMADFDAAETILRDKGAGNEDKYLKLLKANHTFRTLGSSFLRYAKSEDLDMIYAKKAAINVLAKGIDPKRLSIAGLSMDSLRIANSELEYSLYMKQLLNPLLSLEDDVVSALGLDGIWKSYSDPSGLSSKDQMELFYKFYTLVNGSNPEMMHSEHLGKMIELVGANGEVIKYNADKGSRWEEKLNAYEESEGTKGRTELDESIGFLVLKRLHSLILSQKLASLKSGNSPAQADAIDMGTIRTDITTKGTEAFVLAERLKTFGLGVKITEGTEAGDAPYKVTVTFLNEGGVGVKDADGAISPASKLDVIQELTTNIIPANEFNSIGSAARINNFEDNAAGTREGYVYINGKPNLSNVDQAISLIKSKAAGIPEAVQALLYARNPGDYLNTNSLTAGDLNMIVKMISNSVPGFAIVMRDAGGNYDPVKTEGFIRTIVSRLVQESNAGLSLELSQMRGELKAKFGINNGITRLQHLHGMGNMKIFSVTFPPDIADRFNEAEALLSKYGLKLIGNYDSTQNSYYFGKNIEEVSDAVDLFKAFIKRQGSYLESTVSSTNRASTTEVLLKEYWNSRMNADDTAFDSFLIDIGNDIKMRTRRTSAVGSLDTDIEKVKTSLREARDLYKSAISDTTGGKVKDKLETIGKYLRKIQDTEKLVVEAILRSVPDAKGKENLDITKGLPKFPLFDEAEIMAGLASDDRIDDLLKEIVDNLKTDGNTQSNRAALSDLYDRISKLGSLGQNQQTVSNVIKTKLETILNEQDAVVREKLAKDLDSDVDYITNTMHLKIAALTEFKNLLDPVLTAEKELNTAQGEQLLGYLDKMDARIEELRQMKFVGITFDPGKTAIDALADEAARIRTRVTNFLNDQSVYEKRIGDLTSGYNKSWEYDPNNENEVYRYIMTAFMTDGMSTRFSIDEAAKRISPATTVRPISTAAFDKSDALRNLMNTTNGIEIYRMPSPGKGVEGHDGQLQVSRSAMAALEPFMNVSGMSVRFMGSLLKVQTVEDGDLGQGIAFRIYTGDLKSQSASFIGLIKDSLDYTSNKQRFTIGGTVAARENLFRQFVTGLTVQAKPIAGIGDGVASLQANNMAIGSPLYSSTFSAKMILNRMKGQYGSALEYRNAVAAALRRGMNTKQSSNQIYEYEEKDSGNVLDAESYSKFMSGETFIAHDGESSISRADYQAELPILTLAKIAFSYTKAKPRNDAEARVIADAKRIIGMWNDKSHNISDDDLKDIAIRMLDFIASKEGGVKEDGTKGSLVVKEQWEDTAGKKHSVYLTAITRYSKDGIGHTLPFVITNVRGLDYGEKIGINLRGASAQSGDFDKDTVVMYSFSKKGLRSMISGILNIKPEELAEDKVLQNLFYLHRLNTMYESTHPAISFKGGDERNITDPQSAAFFGMLISGYTGFQNDAAIYRADALNGKEKISFNPYSVTEAGDKPYISNATIEEAVAAGTLDTPSSNFLYNSKLIDTNLVLYSEGKGSSEFDRFNNGNLIGGIRTSTQMHGSLLSHGLYWHTVHIGDAQFVLLAKRTSSSIGDVIGIYGTSSGKLKEQLDRAGHKQTDSAETTRKMLGNIPGISIGDGKTKVAWAPDIFRTTSAAFVDYVKSHGGDKGVKAFFGTNDAGEVVNRFNTLNRKLLAATATELVIYTSRNGVRVAAAPVEFARQRDAVGAIHKTNIHISQALAQSENAVAMLANNIVGDFDVTTNIPMDFKPYEDTIFSQVDRSIKSREYIRKGGELLLNGSKITSPEEGEMVKSYINYIKSFGPNDDLANLPVVTRGLVSILRDSSMQEIAYKMSIPENLRSKISLTEFYEALPGLRDTVLPTTEEEIRTIDKLFAVHGFMEGLRATIPGLMNRDALLEIAREGSKSPMLLRDIRDNEDLVDKLYTRMSNSAVTGGKAITKSEIRHFLATEGLRVIEGRDYIVDSPDKIASLTRSGMLSPVLNNNSSDKARIRNNIEFGRYNYLTASAGDNAKPLSVADFYNKLVAYTTKDSNNNVDAQVRARAIYTAFANSSGGADDILASNSSIQAVVIGMARGASNLTSIANSLSDEPRHYGYKYKISVDKVKSSKIGTDNGQVEQSLLGQYKITVDNLIVGVCK